MQPGRKEGPGGAHSRAARAAARGGDRRFKGRTANPIISGELTWKELRDGIPHI
jgi:hypothetical protein